MVLHGYVNCPSRGGGSATNCTDRAGTPSRLHVHAGAQMLGEVAVLHPGLDKRSNNCIVIAMVDTTPRSLERYLTTAQAAKLLGVSQARVRALVASGDLRATKAGHDWSVLRSDVEARADRDARGGRPLSPASAWGLFELADGRVPGWLDRQQRWRISKFIPRLRSGDLSGRLVRRAERRSFHVHPGVMERLRADSALMLTGTSASGPLRLGLTGGPDSVEAYVSEHALQDVVRRYYLEPADDDANVLLRVFPDLGSSWPSREVAPSAAVALDLLEHPDPRARQVGRDLLRAKP